MKKALKVIFIILIIIFVIFASTYTFYKVTKESVINYIPSDYFSYIKINSISSAYNKLIDLRAADLILSQKKLKKIYKTLLDFKSLSISKNRFMASLLNMNANVVLKKDYSAIILIDMGYKSVLVRGAKFITNFIGRQEKFSLNVIERGTKDYDVYRLYLYSNQQEFFFCIYKNLLFFALDIEDIDYLFSVKESGDNIYNDDNFYYIRHKIRKGGIAELYGDTNDVINPVVKNLGKANHIISKLKFEDKSAVSFDISNEDLFLSTFSKFSTDDQNVQNFLERDPEKVDIIQYLPDNTNFYTAASLESFEEFYKLLLYLQQEGYEETIEKIDSACRSLFKMSIDEIIFSWIGDEVGAFTSNTSSSPVLFLKMKDKRQNRRVIEKLTESILIKEDKNILFDGIRLNKIGFPDFLQSIIDSFLPGLDLPYYTIIDNFIFFSMSPESLSNLVRKYDDGITLNFNDVYRGLSSKVGKKAKLFVYFNMAEKIPSFFQMQKFLPQMLKLYEKGMLTLNFDDSSMNMDLAATGMNVRKARLFPGFPIKCDAGIASSVVCKNIAGSFVDELIYTTSNDKLYATDINGNAVDGFPVKMKGTSTFDPFISDFNGDESMGIYVFTDKAYLHRYSLNGNKSHGYPIDTDFVDSPFPVVYNNKFLFYSNKDKKLYFTKKNKKEEFPFEFKSPLMSAVTIYSDTFIFYPKSFSGTIYLTDDSGKILRGWPNDAGGIGYGSPVVDSIGKSSAKKVIFITQAGVLNAWSWGGNVENGFPFQLEGVYYDQPVVGNIGAEENEIVVLNKDGIISIVSSDAKIRLQKEIKDADSKDRKMLLFDANRDGKEEIFIYGGGNNILALDGELNLLSGFPIKGDTKPCFTDFDSDGQYEIVAGSVDDCIYAYTIPQ